MIRVRRARLSNGLLADTLDWVSRVNANSGSLTASQISAVDLMARRIYAAGLRSSISRLNPMVGNASTIVVPYWKDWGPSLDILTGSPTVDANGMTVAGTTQWLRTGITPSAQTGWDSTNTHMGVQVVYGNPIGTDNSLMGCWSNSGTLRYGIRWTSSSNVAIGFYGTNTETLTVSGRTKGILSGHRMIGANAGVTSYYEEGVSVVTTGTNPTNGKPTTEIVVGNATSSALAGNFIIGGYHIGGALSAAGALLLGEVWHQLTQSLNRQRSMLGIGDSLTSLLTWLDLYQSSFSPQGTVTRSATGGISSATCLSNLITAIAATPAIKWYNWHIWIGQNDGGVGYSTTVANTQSIIAQTSHSKMRIASMLYKNVANEFTGQSVRLLKDAVTASLTASYPTKMTTYPTLLRSAGGTGAAGTVAQDARDVANGVMPSSYHLDVASPANVSAITQAANAKITTATPHGCVTGDTVYVSGTVVGMTQIQGVYDTVTVIDANNVTMDHTDSTAFTAYTSGGALTIKDSVHLNPTADALIAANLNTSTSTWSW